MKILIASPEAVPYAKTGGLADVVGSLVKEYRRTKEDAYVVLPLYKSIKNSKKPPVDTGLEIKVPVGGKKLKLKPDVIHCNDWQTGLIPLYLKTIYRNDKFLKNTAGQPPKKHTA